MRPREEQSATSERLIDVRLVSRAKAGSETAYTELYKRHSRMVYRVIWRITRNSEDAEDLLQEAFLRVVVNLESFDGRSSFSSWFTRIGINCALMSLRKRRRRRETPMDAWDESDVSLNLIADGSPDPEQYYARWEERHRLEQAIDRLPAILRGPVALRCHGDLSVKDVASLMGISVAAAKSRLSRASRQLRSALSRSRRSQRVMIEPT
jgi:RNA polymerase sigma-70 factor (ECF subfamily)